MPSKRTDRDKQLAAAAKAVFRELNEVEGLTDYTRAGAEEICRAVARAALDVVPTASPLESEALRRLHEIVAQAEYSVGPHTSEDGWTNTPLGRRLGEAEAFLAEVFHAPPEASRTDDDESIWIVETETRSDLWEVVGVFSSWHRAKAIADSARDLVIAGPYPINAYRGLHDPTAEDGKS